MDPSAGYAILGVKQFSGDDLIGEAFGDEISPVGSALTRLALRWRLKRWEFKKDSRALVPIADITLVLKPIHDFDYKDPNSFILQIPKNAVSESEAARIAALKAEALAGQSILNHRTALDVRELSNESLRPDSPGAGKKDRESEAPKMDIKPDERSNKSDLNTDGASSAQRRPNVIALAGLLFILVLGMVGAAAIRASAPQRTLVMYKRVFIGVGLLIFVALACLVYANPLPQASGDQFLSNKQYSENDGNWVSDLAERPYSGHAVQETLNRNYNGKLKRENGIETHIWYIGPSQSQVVIEKETMRVFISGSPAPVKTVWAPTVYTIVKAYERAMGQTINIGSVKPLQIDLGALRLMSPDMEHLMSSPVLETETPDAQSRIVRIRDGKVILFETTILHAASPPRTVEKAIYYGDKNNIVYQEEIKY